MNQIVDRTNEVRTRWGRHQSTYDLNLYSRPSVDTIDKLHSQIDEAKYNPEKMAELKNHPRLNNISLVHPEIKEAGYGWEIIDRPNEAQNNQVNI